MIKALFIPIETKKLHWKYLCVHDKFHVWSYEFSRGANKSHFSQNSVFCTNVVKKEKIFIKYINWWWKQIIDVVRKLRNLEKNIFAHCVLGWLSLLVAMSVCLCVSRRWVILNTISWNVILEDLREFNRIRRQALSLYSSQVYV